MQGATLEAKRATPPKAGPAQSTATEPSQQPSSDDLGGVPLDKIGSAVTVVTGEQLRAQQIRHAGDALRSLPGVAVNRYWRLRKQDAGAHSWRRGQPHAGPDRRHRGQRHERRGVRLLGSVNRGHRAHRGHSRPAKRAVRLQGHRRRDQRHHQGRQGAVHRLGAHRGRSLRHERRRGSRIRRQRQGVVRGHRTGASLAVLQYRQERFGGGPGAPDHPGAQGWRYGHAGHGGGLQRAQRQQICAHRHRTACFPAVALSRSRWMHPIPPTPTCFSAA